MKYSVIHSNDPYLLARMATDLQMSKANVDLGWCEGRDYNPFSNNTLPIRTLVIDNNNIEFHNHSGILGDEEFISELTESNYLQVLESVLS